ncbi:DUF2267 domain-containing protein [Chitinispirillales bacterium ANBcel5]|uniref:DUF2267 domain-containing protein n=1 Tax=Cellulosispirillum alkaliphilum TaxID=3039283 RepID=UPI002A57AC18|nr:DUF2267 domain-containing protein [Chitinispirillales bacterium ANBcel5]
MTMTGLESFDTAVQKADIWLKEIMQEMGVDSRRRAYGALRAVLHSLRDRLTLDEAADLGAQLPMLVRGIYYDEWDPSRNPVKIRHIDDFLNYIQQNYHSDGEISTDKIARSVFNVLKRRVTEGEIKDVKGMMPEELLELWK